jgi:hypothetical protein
MPHSCGQVPATHPLSTGHTLQIICCFFIKDLFVMGDQYFWWASKILYPGYPGTTTPLLDFGNPDILRRIFPALKHALENYCLYALC